VFSGVFLVVLIPALFVLAIFLDFRLLYEE